MSTHSHAYAGTENETLRERDPLHLGLPRPTHTAHTHTPNTDNTGTENEALRERDPLYLGLPQKRIRGEAYYSLMQVRAICGKVYFVYRACLRCMHACMEKRIRGEAKHPRTHQLGGNAQQ